MLSKLKNRCDPFEVGCIKNGLYQLSVEHSSMDFPRFPRRKYPLAVPPQFHKKTSKEKGGLEHLTLIKGR